MVSLEDVKHMNEAKLGYRGPMVFLLLRGKMKDELKECENLVKEGTLIRIDEEGDVQGYWLPIVNINLSH